MRVLQMIDSLEAGGAERMTVNFANALSQTIEFSGLVVTRKEGALKEQIDSRVTYLFLNKKKAIDLHAISKLRNYIVKNKITVIHAHSSSFFLAVLLKFTLPKIKIAWHDHYGKRIHESKVKNSVLVFFSVFFSSIFTVNPLLEKWNKKNMLCSKVFFIPNFAILTEETLSSTFLKGTKDKRIVFLANLKNPKNHLMIVKAFENLKLSDLGWSLHLIGKDYFDEYSDSIKIFIKENHLEDNIYLYNSRNDIAYILSQATIGILASTDEGFPVTLLEYGLVALPVVSTNVGYCSSVIKDNITGLLFNPLKVSEFENQILKLISNSELRNQLGMSLNNVVSENYAKDVVIQKLILAYKA
ncbi:glycosyltransferase [Flavobacterium hydatis]|uniref:Alpha-1,4-N-acetylgalactosamine transferase n=1 Tax=Flavobacterium hydatis TaxID=991 RepID=A0A086ANH6_FLAHY|nr:glycosyltransferase [Flavobacterium hydatis]KFF18240.1 alpha-1,4-N-acetylgalactosamine transferase [Flavobacterium hydatis]OXA97015.1 alpha-1,4-N-acetylgalactosamine transferase [Flavobacterium hydatis]